MRTQDTYITIPSTVHPVYTMRTYIYHVEYEHNTYILYTIANESYLVSWLGGTYVRRSKEICVYISAGTID